MKTKQFQVDGYSEREVEVACHEAGHAVGALALTASSNLLPAETIKEIILFGAPTAGLRRIGTILPGGACYPNVRFGRALDCIIFCLAGHQAARACGVPWSLKAPNFHRRDSDYQHAVDAARESLGLLPRVGTYNRKLRPILDSGVQRARQLVSENLGLIKAIAVALLTAPKDAKGDRRLTGAQVAGIAEGSRA